MAKESFCTLVECPKEYATENLHSIFSVTTENEETGEFETRFQIFNEEQAKLFKEDEVVRSLLEKGSVKLRKDNKISAPDETKKAITFMVEEIIYSINTHYGKKVHESEYLDCSELIKDAIEKTK